MTEQQMKDLLAAARLTNDRRDAGERANGFTAPGDSGLGPWLRTGMEAIRAGIVIEDWECVAEGLVMLEDCYSAAEKRGIA